MMLRRSTCTLYIPWVSAYARMSTLSPTPAKMNAYTSIIDAEPLARYKREGYHPVKLGTLLHDNRYKILHKLGWGAYSTVWAARDCRANTYVAIKILISEQLDDERNQECRVMNMLASLKANAYLRGMLDDFDIDGPNGTHKCLVLELLGPSVSDVVEARFLDGRLPRQLAKTTAEQSLRGLKTLHELEIGHGDIYVGNLAFVLPRVNDMSEETFIDMLGTPKYGRVERMDGQPREHGVPEYIVESASYQKKYLKSLDEIKIVDFGQSFLPTFVPRTLRTPLALRPPEVVFGSDPLDFRVDLWSMGCMLFELFVGQPPFDGLLSSPEVLVEQMKETATDELPKRWQNLLNVYPTAHTRGSSLHTWLEEMYFDNERKMDLTKEDITILGGLIAKLLRFEPRTRASASEILSDPWFT